MKFHRIPSCRLERRRRPGKTGVDSLRATAAVLVAACAACAPAQADLDSAVERHLLAIQERDLEAFASTLTREDTLYTILPDGTALTTPQEALELHEAWFPDPSWIWQGKIVRKIVGADMATILVRYDYRDTPDAAPRSSWLVLVFRLEDGEWRLVHDQNTRIAEPGRN